LKGANNAIDWCKSNSINFTLVKDIAYDAMLESMRKHQLLVYLPNAKDTCPRMVIEAKLLGCELIINENVQHKDESWFLGSNEQILDYLASRPNAFWRDSLIQMEG